MMRAPEPGAYSSPRAVEAAIKDAAAKAAAADPSLSVNERIRLEYFNRFLSRVFSEGDDSSWVLKGGTGVLARVISARSTLDIDLYRRGVTMEQALADLQRVAAVDLGDHFRFEYEASGPILGGDMQPYLSGSRATFQVIVGTSRKTQLQVDVAVGVHTTQEAQTMAPANALNLPKLVAHPYKLYPIVDQIADKVCATVGEYLGQPSSREKDLVDLVVLAVTHDLDGTALARALVTEFARRQMSVPDRFAVPASWGRGHRKQSAGISHCAEHPTVEHAQNLVAQLIDPALKDSVAGQTWVAANRIWQ